MDQKLIRVKVNGKFGFANARGNIVIPPRYDDVEEFSPFGLTMFRIGNQWGIVNTDGDEIMEDRSDDFFYAYSKYVTIFEKFFESFAMFI